MIDSISKQLSDTQALKKWGVQIKPTAIAIETEVLPVPALVGAKGALAEEKVLRRQPIAKSQNLDKTYWIMAYAKHNFQSADKPYN